MSPCARRRRILRVVRAERVFSSFLARAESHKGRRFRFVRRLRREPGGQIDEEESIQ